MAMCAVCVYVQTGGVGARVCAWIESAVGVCIRERMCACEVNLCEWGERVCVHSANPCVGHTSACMCTCGARRLCGRTRVYVCAQGVHGRICAHVGCVAAVVWRALHGGLFRPLRGNRIPGFWLRCLAGFTSVPVPTEGLSNGNI